MTSGDGKTIIREGLSGQDLEGGFTLLFRYHLKRFEDFTSEIASGIVRGKARRFVSEFLYYASRREWSEEQCAADLFEPFILPLPEPLQYGFFRNIPYAFRGKRMLDFYFPNCRMALCHFYLLCFLPFSLKKSLANHRASMEREELYVLLEALTLVDFRDEHLTTLLQVLTDEGVVARLFEDDPHHMKGEVKEILSRIREKLSTSEDFSKFKIKYGQRFDGESQERQIEADAMALMN